MTEEHNIQNEIRLEMSKHGIILFRTNAGVMWQGKKVYSHEFKQDVLINLRPVVGLPEGHADLSGLRKSDGRAVFIEVKTPTGRVSEAQQNFIQQMQRNHAIAGVARSVEDALKVVGIT